MIELEFEETITLNGKQLDLWNVFLDGEFIGRVQVRQESSTLVIEDFLRATLQPLSPGTLRKVFEALREEYSGVTSIMGRRITGAGPGRTARVALG